MGTAVKQPVPDWVKPLLVIFYIRVLVTGSVAKLNDWLDKSMTDWWLEVDLAIEYDWRRLSNNVTGGGA